MNTRTPQRIALVAHDGAKTAMLELVDRHQSVLRASRLVATATTGSIGMAQVGSSTSSNGGSIGYTAQAGSLALTSLNAGSGPIAVTAGTDIVSTTGYFTNIADPNPTNINLTGASALIVASKDLTLRTKANALNVTADGKIQVFDVITGTLFGAEPTPAAAEPSVTATLITEVVKVVQTTTEKLADPVTPQTTSTSTPTSNALTLGATTGGTDGTFGDESKDDPTRKDKDTKTTTTGTPTDKPATKTETKNLPKCG